MRLPPTIRMHLSGVNPTLDDSDLLAQARRASPTALAALYERHGGALLRLGTRLTGSAADAEDLLHDLFVALPELLARYEHRATLGAWLHGVMAKMAIGRLRLRNRRDVLAGDASPPSATRTDPWNAIDLERAIAGLPDMLRAVFVLRQLEGHSHDEVAALLGISSGASRVRHLRALRLLRASLEDSQ